MSATPKLYYQDKVESLRYIFGATDVIVSPGGIQVDGRWLPVVDDVIVALLSSRLPAGVSDRIDGDVTISHPSTAYAADVQRSFGDEWRAHPRILPEHQAEFEAYFDLVDLSELQDKRLCDLGCGIGRWSHFLAARCREVVLVDFSEAIFVARHNLAESANAIFVMADILDLPFRNDAFDLVYCLGVLHHLPIKALDALRTLRNLAPVQLVYLYYSLENRPAHYRWLLRIVTALRRRLAGVHSPEARLVITWTLALGVYAPLVAAGRLARPFGFEHLVPLADTYSGKSLARIRQDVYDRFFTSIEQRFSREQILGLLDTFSAVDISDSLPYWHFLCHR